MHGVSGNEDHAEVAQGAGNAAHRIRLISARFLFKISDCGFAYIGLGSEVCLGEVEQGARRAALRRGQDRGSHITATLDR
jgi:hypothetical protein